MAPGSPLYLGSKSLLFKGLGTLGTLARGLLGVQ